MSYQPPPTFADDTVLSAAALNILSQNIEYLAGIVQGPNIPFPANELELQGISEYYRIRHQHRFLVMVLQFEIDTSWVASIDWALWYGKEDGLSTNRADSDTFVNGDEGTLTRVLDLHTGAITATSAGDGYANAGHVPPTPGSWYTLEVRATRDGAYSGNSYFRLLALYESDTDPTA
jgi:hypothetical protein